MGLGKTLQTLSFLTYLKHNLNNPGPYLVICPLSVLGSWMNEAKKWTPQLSVFQFHGDASNRAFLKEKLLQKETKPDVIVTTFEQFLAEQHYFKHRFHYQAVVIDEGHKIKNEKTQLATALFGLTTRFKMLLTGTPLQNK
jgi:SWI/SNF-related matrix-associated actin-dependent regulator of chromatin subfamily A member 5